VGAIVVGVDNSLGAQAALAFSLEEARLRSAPLRVVHAWRFGYIGAVGAECAVPVLGGDRRELRRAAAAELDAIVAEASAGAHDVEIEKRVREGLPAAVLIEESGEADLLVVGSRGHGGFVSLLLGSVSQQCADHAASPVVIVRSHCRAVAENDEPRSEARPG
jgi:nucleotide-binding universal stress UspA family protein